jgi:hypothetical protein
MGPVIGVPTDVADTIKDKTDLVEVDQVLPDVVDEPDLQLGARPFGDILLLTETPSHGYGPLIDVLVEYAETGPKPFELTVMDKDGNPHAFPAHTEPSADLLRQHLTSAFYGEPGDRRPLIREGDSPSP